MFTSREWWVILNAIESQQERHEEALKDYRVSRSTRNRYYHSNAIVECLELHEKIDRFYRHAIPQETIPGD